MLAHLRVRDALFLLCAAVLIVVMFGGAASSARYSGDEADYMFAAKMGFAQNYLERGSMSAVELARLGIRSVRDRTSRADLSEAIRGRADIPLYRHYHPPLLSHWLILASGVAGSENEGGVRSLGLAFHVLTFFTVYLGVFWLWDGQARLAAALASSLYLFSITNIKASLSISVHQLFAWLALLALLAMARLVLTGGRKYLTPAAMLTTLAFCAMAYYGLVLFAVLALCLFVSRRELFGGLSRRDSWGCLAKAGVAALCTLAVVWPAGLLKLSVVKPFANAAYLMLFRKGSALADVGIWQLWAGRLERSSVEFSLVLLCVVAGLFTLREPGNRRVMLPLLFYPLVVLLTARPAVAPPGATVVDTVRYLASALPPLFIAGGFAFGRAVSRLRPRLSYAVPALVFVLLFLHLRGAPVTQASHPDVKHDAVAALLARRSEIRTVLLPQTFVPIVHYYAPELRIRSYDPAAGGEDTWQRLGASQADAAMLREARDADLRARIEAAYNAMRVTAPTDTEDGVMVLYFLAGRK